MYLIVTNTILISKPKAYHIFVLFIFYYRSTKITKWTIFLKWNTINKYDYFIYIPNLPPLQSKYLIKNSPILGAWKFKII